MNGAIGAGRPGCRNCDWDCLTPGNGVRRGSTLDSMNTQPDRETGPLYIGGWRGKHRQGDQTGRSSRIAAALALGRLELPSRPHQQLVTAADPGGTARRRDGRTD